jgi:trehalose 6-phosphate synthase/phosphatase
MEYLIVANRLPFVIKKDLSFERSPGGLVSGLLTFLKRAKIRNYKWIGWPGKDIDKKKFPQVQAKCQRYKTYPVFISKKELDRFYNGFCNKTLWPLFHGFQSYVYYDKVFWNSYVSVNQTFCEEVSRFIKEDTIVWIHDYHFMLLPAMLRERFPNLMIGFFLHIPFPPPELFMQLPWRKDLLEGLLGCDLIGFHAYEYTNNFLRTLSRTLGLEHKMGTLFYQNRYIKADTFPIGIDFELFNKASQQKKIQSLVNKIKRQLKDKKIVFSVDRLDYTKGIYNRLLAFEELLSRFEEFRGKVVLIMVVVPSREGVEQYQRMKRQLEEKISEINGKFGFLQTGLKLWRVKAC